MNARIIRQLRNKFIKMFMIAISLVMLFLGAVLNTTNFISSQRLIFSLLDYIVLNEGSLPEDIRDSEHNHSTFDQFSSEYSASARYFTVTLDEDGDITNVDTSHISRIDEDEAKEYAQEVLKRTLMREYGRIGTYYYRSADLKNGKTMMAFLDCSAQILANRRMVSVTVLICLIGLALTYLLLRKFSGYIIQPELERIKSQKLFITNASHELKTPLAVIRANTEVQEMMDGETEWTRSTRKQVDRMDGLIRNLVMISRAQERESGEELTPVPMTRIVKDSVEPFSSLAIQDEKELVTDLAPDIEILADESGIQQLTTLLVDNAIKYCDEKGTIRVVLDRVSVRFGGLRKNSAVRLVVSNSYAEGEHADYTKFFERFYREDESHNADRGGYGIGLSVAESLCRQYQGRIRANWKDGMIYFICEFPLACDEEEKP